MHFSIGYYIVLSTTAIVVDKSYWSDSVARKVLLLSVSNYRDLFGNSEEEETKNLRMRIVVRSSEESEDETYSPSPTKLS